MVPDRYWSVPLAWAPVRSSSPATHTVVVIADSTALAQLRAWLTADFADFAGDRDVYGSNVVGIDVEWRPHNWVCHTDTHACVSNAARPWPASLVQIATGRSVYLVDLLSLYAERSSSDDRKAAVDAGFAASVAWLLPEYVPGLVSCVDVPRCAALGCLG